MKDFTITKLKWRIETAEELKKAGYEVPSLFEIEHSMKSLARFLQENRLTNRVLITGDVLRGGLDFTLNGSDLTEVGLAVIRGGFGKWEKMGCPGDDLRPLLSARKTLTTRQP